MAVEKQDDQIPDSDQADERNNPRWVLRGLSMAMVLVIFACGLNNPMRDGAWKDSSHCGNLSEKQVKGLWEEVRSDNLGPYECYRGNPRANQYQAACKDWLKTKNLTTTLLWDGCL